MGWPLRKKKLCFATKQCSVLFSILCLTVPTMDIWGIFQVTFVLMNYKKTQLKMTEYPELEGGPTRIIRVQVLALHLKTPRITPCAWESSPHKGLANCTSPEAWCCRVPVTEYIECNADTLAWSKNMNKTIQPPHSTH